MVMAYVQLHQARLSQADFRPIDGQPIYWDITAPARYDGTRAVTAEVRTRRPPPTEIFIST